MPIGSSFTSFTSGKSLSSVVFRLRNILSCYQEGRPTQEYVGLIEARAQELLNTGINISPEYL